MIATVERVKDVRSGISAVLSEADDAIEVEREIGHEPCAERIETSVAIVNDVYDAADFLVLALGRPEEYDVPGAMARYADARDAVIDADVLSALGLKKIPALTLEGEDEPDDTKVTWAAIDDVIASAAEAVLHFSMGLMLFEGDGEIATKLAVAERLESTALAVREALDGNGDISAALDQYHAARGDAIALNAPEEFFPEFTA